ncbi:restriction modification system DNA specificity domain [Methanoregula boonei 6A8]|uniref:Restriction modification system DNA specificity domain n=1 Tax=Methanoregula boonei (strain DSM 21154 / JCM 14090 / 6A8) TaxID=456442 RepID=A7I739_METB6|nr:restriction endonuclease subunit S [Methanoregula boonei]ABS55550.1 restriction modification system DNA specificity domain [Methanoregula boonei 6A8]
MSLTVPVAEIINSSTNPLLAIDPSWERVPLGKIAKVLNGFAFKSELFNDKKGTPLIRIRDIGNNKTECYYDGVFDEAYVIHPGDLLVGMDGDFNCSTWRGPKALLNQRVCKIEVNIEQYNRKFLEYVLPGYLKAINENTSSQTVKHLSSRSISEILLPNPPLTEQQRIVARVEALLSHVNAARERLSRVPLIMKKFRQAVLAAACSGGLTEGWRKENPDIEEANKLVKRLESIRKQFKIREISSIDNLELSDLPDSWTWIRLANIAIVMDPDHKMPKSSDGGIIFISPKDFKENYQIDMTKTKRISDEEFLRLSKKFVPRPLDILYSRIGADLGKARKAPQDIKFHISYSLAVIRQLGEMENSDYLFWLLNSMFIRNQAFENVRSIGVPDLGLRDIDNFIIPLPPLAEQYEIVRRVGLLFERADAIDREVEAATRRCERLTQAVLGKAFRGELTRNL